jgi:WD40 repeat protein
MDIEPLVRIWKIDGGGLETKITETGPVTALAWRGDGGVLATATNLDNACDGASPCECGGFYAPYYGGYPAPTPVPAPALGAPKDGGTLSSSRTRSQLLAVLLGTCFGHYGGMGSWCEADRANVSLWDPATGKLLIALGSPSAPVVSIAFSPDNRHIAAGTSSFTGITLWSISSQWLLANGRGDGAITDLLYSQDSRRLASFSQCNNTVRLWEGAAGSLVARLEAAGPFMQFLPTARFLAQRQEGFTYSCGPGSAGPLARWLSQDGSEEGHPGERVGVQAYTIDGKRFVANVMMPQPRLVVYDGQSGAEICTLAESAAAMGLLKVQISKDGARVAALTWGEALLWDGNTGRLLARRTDASASDLSPDGTRWAVATKPMFAAPPAIMPIPVPQQGDSKEPPKGPPDEPAKLRPAGQGVFGFPKIVRDPEPKAPPMKELDDVPPAPKALPGVRNDFTPKPPTLTLFDGNGKEIAKLTGVEFHCDTLTFDPTGKSLIAVANLEIVKVYKADSGKLTAQFRTNDAKIAISPDGNYLAIHRPQPLFPPISAVPPKRGPAKEVAPKAPPPKVGAIIPMPGMSELISQLPTSEPKKSPAPGPQPAGIDGELEPAFSQGSEAPGGRRIMFVTLIDLSNGQPVWNASVAGTGHGGLAFSADGKRLALGYVDGKSGFVQVWSTSAPEGDEKWKHEIVARYSGHHGAVNAVAFSPDGKRLASGGADRVVKVWKLPAEGETGPGVDVPAEGTPSVVSAK